MGISNGQELYVFFGTLLGGAAAGLLFDIFRIWRKNFKTTAVLVWVQDILFWIGLAAIVYATIFITNSAQVRWYEFAGIGLGFGLYLLTLSRLIVGVSSLVISVVKRVLLFLLKIVLFPFVLLYRRLRQPVLWIWGGMRRLGRWCRRRGRDAGRRAKRNAKRFGRVFRKV